MAWDFSITSTCKRAKIKSYIIECRIKEKKNDMIYAHNDIFYWLKTNYTKQLQHILPEEVVFCEYDNIRLKTEYSFLHFEKTDYHFDHRSFMKLFS